MGEKESISSLPGWPTSQRPLIRPESHPGKQGSRGGKGLPRDSPPQQSPCCCPSPEGEGSHPWGWSLRSCREAGWRREQLTLHSADRRGRPRSAYPRPGERASVDRLVFGALLVAQQQKQASCQQHEPRGPQGHRHDAQDERGQAVHRRSAYAQKHRPRQQSGKGRPAS